MRRLLISALALSVVSLWLLPAGSAHASIGVQQECYINDSTSFVNFGMDSNDGEAQTFTPSGSYNIGAIKWNVYRTSVTDGASIILSIHPTSGTAPDLNTTLGSETFDTTLVPIADATFPHTDNTFSCDPNVDTGQVVEFDPPIPVTSGILYAIVARGVGGSTTDDFIVPFTPFDNTYPSGTHWECNAPTACSLFTPGTWDQSGGVHDSGFAIFDNIVTTVPQGTADTWLQNFLRDFLGLDSPTGKLIFGLGFSLVVIVGLLFLKVHVLVSMGMGGFTMAAATLGLLVPPEVFLAGFAVVGVAVLIGATVLRGGGEEA